MTLRFSCPSCLAPLTRPVSASGRVVCGRCGESAVAPAGYHPASGEQAPQPRKSRPTWPIVGGIILACGLAVALWWSVTLRPGDPAPVPVTAAEVALDPIMTPNLGWVPPTATVVFVARPRQIPDARTRLTAAGVPADLLASLEKAGLQLDTIDELVGGLVILPDTLIPRAVLVATLTTREATDQLRGRLNATAAGPRGMFQVTVRNVPVYGRTLSDRTLIFATDLADLEVSDPSPGGTHLPGDVQATIARIPHSRAAWLATGVQPWETVPLVVLGQQFLRRDSPNRAAGVTALWTAMATDGAPQLETRSATGDWTDLSN